jgi:hypothetical protein
MERVRRTALLVGLAAVGILAAAAVVVPMFVGAIAPAPGSSEYRPVSEKEAAVFASANRTVHPEDVRRTPARYQHTLVAWAGVVRNMTTSEDGSHLVIRFDVEHRYFDWIYDFGIQRAHYFLSPRGEGSVRLAWAVPLSRGEAVLAHVQPGHMLVAYGYPSEVRDGAVILGPTEYVRAIPQSEYSDTTLDYGRPRP